MKQRTRQNWAVVMAFAALWMILGIRQASAQDHVVPLTELQRQMRSGAEARARNAADLERVFSSPAARDAFQKYKVAPEQAKKAVSLLNDEELSRLAERARAAEKDVEGGFIVGILALIGLVVVILVVLAVVNKD